MVYSEEVPTAADAIARERQLKRRWLPVCAPPLHRQVKGTTAAAAGFILPPSVQGVGEPRAIFAIMIGMASAD
jgi:hypothetical protein